jgi:hypothetical protein
MRFACQSCGKAYNLPEEKIADKSNVKLKCRVCGAIVEVKKQGEVVASILGEGENKRGRVSEAPAPLTSMMPDDSDDATHAIAVSDHILSEGASDEDAASALMGHVKSALGQRGLPPLPPPAPTGFGSPPAAGFGAATASGLAASAPGFGAPPALGYAPSPAGFGPGAPPGFAPTPVPPPLVPDLPPFGRPDASGAPSLPSSLAGSGPGSPPPPLPNAEHSHAAGSQGMSSLQNGSNGASRFGDAVLSEDPLPAGMASVAMSAAGGGGAVAMSPLGSGEMGSYSGMAPVDVQPRAQETDTTRKMLAALATGILIGFIIARLFF